MRKSWFKRAMVIALALVLVITSLPEGTHAKTTLSITASTQEELDAALTTKNVSSILIQTDETADLKVNKGSYSKVVLTVEAPKATISNYGKFKKIIINKAKKFYETATDNSIYVNDDKLTIKTSKKASITNLVVNNDNTKLTVSNPGKILRIKLLGTTELDYKYGSVGRIYVSAPSDITLKGDTEAKLPITVKTAGEGTTITAYRPVKVNAYSDIDVIAEEGSAGSSVTLKKLSAGVSFTNNDPKKATIVTFAKTKKYVKAGKTVITDAYDLNQGEQTQPAEDVTGAAEATPEAEVPPTNIPIYLPVSPEGTKPTPTPAPESTPTPTPCKLSFALGEGCTLAAQLPEAREYKAGSEIGKLPNAYISNGIFGGWYYDSAMTKPVKASDTIKESITIYGDLTMAAEKQIVETPQYAVVEVPADKVSGFSFEIKGYTDGCIESFINSASAETVKYEVEAGKVIPQLQKGKTYTVKLTEDCTAQYVIDGVEKGVTAKELTITTEKEEVLNLSVSDDIVFVPVKEVSELNGLVFDGLFTTSVDGNGNLNTKENKYEGSFAYAGDSIKVGDTVAIYEGLRPDQRDFSGFETGENGGVAYVNITAKNGNTYSFKTADTQDVLKKPEVLPVPKDEDKDGKSDHSITVDASVFDFSDAKYAELGYDGSTTVDEGDFLLFYTGDFATASNASYAKVTKVSRSGEDYVIEYVDSTEDEVLSSMDMYNSRKADIKLTQEEIDTLTKNLEDQALASGFLDDAANYLVALAFETDGFKELSDDLDLDLASYNIKLADGTALTDSDLALMDGGSEAKITKKEAKVYITPGYRLQMFEGYSGLRIEMVMTLTVTIGEQDEKKDHLELELQACFEEEVLFGIDIDGGADWEWAGIFPYIDDYEVSASLDWGTAVCAGITATLKTVKGKEDPFEWKNVTGFKAEDSILDIGKQLTKLMSEKEQFMGETILDENGEEVEATSNAGGLVDKYKAFMEDAQKDECWVTIVEKEIFDTEGVVDPLGIIVYGISAKFVVKMNLYITVGATYESGEGTRYSFYMRIWDRTVKTSETPIMEPHVNYDFYVFGTLGIKVGLEFEFGVGLFSLKLDSVGITAEVGVYFTIAGYFYAHYTMTQKNGKIEKDSSLSGALSMEIGIYLEIKFKAQLFSSDKFTYEPTLLEKSWPIWTLGEPENVVAFVDLYEDDDPLKPQGDYEDYDDVLEMVWNIDLELPVDYFEMDVLDLFSGESKTKLIENKDIDEKFTVKFTNDNFRFDGNTNSIYMTAKRGTTDREETDMTITWNGDPLAFTTKPIQRKIKIIWTDPINARYISFDTKGGTYVKTIAVASGTKIEQPADPSKTGYDFGGWFTKSGTAFTIPSTMPNYESGGVNLYAKWIPRTDTKYVVNHYKQKLDGMYELAEAEPKQGTTDYTPSIDELKKEYDNYFVKTYALSSIRPDGSAVITIYYALNNYEVSFSFGTMKNGSYKTEDIKYTAKYGATLSAPVLYIEGYHLDGYEGLTTDDDGCFTVTGAATYTAQWSPATDTPYTIEHYVSIPGSPDYELYEITPAKGVTGSDIDVAAGRFTDSRFVYTQTTIVNTDETKPVINADGSSVIKIYYNRNTYKLSYMDGASSIGTPADIEWGMKITEPAAPTKQGYVFDAWYTDKECTAANVFDFKNSVMPAAAFTLYAGWKSSDQTAYTVEYYGQDADDASKYVRMDSQTCYGTTDKEVSGVYKDFDHYVKNESYTGRVDKAVVKADGSTVLKLYYDRTTVTVSFDANGGTLGADGASKTFRYGQLFNATAPTRDGYAFEGWFLGDTKYTATTITETSAFTLTAHWKEGAVNFVAEHYVMDVNGTYPSTPNFTDNTLSGTVGEEITLASLKKADLEVTGGITYDCAEVGGTDVTIATVASGLTVKLYYKRIRYKLTWNLNNEVPTNDGAYTTGDVYYGADIIAPIMSKTGYTYSFSAVAPEKMPEKDVTIDVTCQANTYKIRFNKNAEDATGSMNDLSVNYDEQKKLPANSNSITRPGYTFQGWTDDPNSTVAKYIEAVEGKDTVFNLTSVDGTIIDLYAVWKGKEYDVTLNVNPNNWDWQDENKEVIEVPHFVKESDNVTEYIFGQTITLPTPEFSGYSFAGWYEGFENGKVKGEPINTLDATYVSGKESVVLYADWVKKTLYEIKWDSNGKDENSSDVSKLEGVKEATATNGLVGHVKDGYSISGTHVYHYPGDPAAYVYAPKNPTRNSTAEWDYTFDGWYTEKIPDSTESRKTEPSYVKMFNVDADADPEYYTKYADVEIKDDVTYYAHWVKTPRCYSIKWYTNGRLCYGAKATEADLIKSPSTSAYLNRLNDLGVMYLINKNGGADFTGNQNPTYDSKNNEYVADKVAYGTVIVAPICVMTDKDQPEATYEFLGWYNVKDCEWDYETVYRLKNTDAKRLEYGDILTEDTTYVAIWEETTKKYTIYWMGNAPTGTEVTLTGDAYTCKDGNAVAYGTRIVAPGAVCTPGTQFEYEFAGWFTGTSDGTQLTDTATVAADATYYAHWTPKSE